MPRFIQHFEYKSVSNGPKTGRTLHFLCHSHFGHGTFEDYFLLNNYLGLGTWRASIKLLPKMESAPPALSSVLLSLLPLLSHVWHYSSYVGEQVLGCRPVVLFQRRLAAPNAGAGQDAFASLPAALFLGIIWLVPSPRRLSRRCRDRYLAIQVLVPRVHKMPYQILSLFWPKKCSF